MTLSQRFRPVFAAILMLVATATSAMAQYRVSLSADRPAAVEGQSVTLRAVVTINGVPATQGTIFFTGNGGASDVIEMHSPDASGGATLSTYSLGIGRHEITARYNQNSTTVNNLIPKSPPTTIAIVSGAPFGALTTPIAIADPCAGVPALADFNNDGILDHLSACTSGHEVLVRIGNGDGTFQSATVLSTGIYTPSAVVGADFNNDGRKDIVALGSAGHTSLSYFKNLGNGSFDPAVVTDFGGTIAASAGSLALINADGNPVVDLLMTTPDAARVLNINGSTSTFTLRFATPWMEPPLGQITASAVGDIDADGRADFAISVMDWGGEVEGFQRLFIFKGDGQLGFTSIATGAWMPGESTALVIDDVTGDGLGDVVSVQGQVWPGLANGSLGAPQPYVAVPTLPLDFDPAAVIADLDHDGRLDVATTSAVMLAKALASMTMTVEGSPAPGDPFTIRATVSGAFGSASGGSVTFSHQYGTLGTAAVDETGVATLTPSAWAVVGSNLISATFSGDTTYGSATASATVTIVKAPSEMFLYVSPETPGHNQPFTVQAGVRMHGPSAPNGGLMIVTIDNQPPAQHAGAFVDLDLALPGGTHTITVAYTGDSVYLPGSITQTFTVVQATTQTSVTSNAWWIQFGSQLELTANVTSGGTSAPTGSVTFMDGDQVMGTVQVDGTAPALWTTSPATAGLHHYRAVYLPNNPAYLASESSTIGVSVMLPGGGLRRPISAPTAGTGGVVRVGDLNHDGKMDAVVVQGATLSVFHGNGDLTFQPRVDIALPANALAFELFDNTSDGHLDAFVAFTAVDGPIETRELHGSGSGGFPSYVERQLPGTYRSPTAIGIGDFTGDGRRDFVIADGAALSRFSNGGAPLGTATLSIWPSSLTLGDLNGDGRADLVASQWQAQTQLVMLADGAGGFSAPVWTGSSSADPSLFDFDTDGILDLLTVDDQVTMFRGNGDGTFQGGVVIGPAPGASLAMGDLNNDAVFDVVTVGEALHAMAGAAPVAMTAVSNRDYIVDPGVPVTVTATLTANGTPVGPIRFHATSTSSEGLVQEWHQEVTPVDGIAAFTNVYPQGWLDITVEYDGDATFGAASAVVNHFVLFAPPPVNTAPTLTMPAPIIVEADRATGTVVNYTVTAHDAEDGALPATCRPLSGRRFPLGTTTVSCKATDSEGLVTTGSFTITVQDTTAPTITFKANRDPYDAHQNVNIRCVAKDAVSGIASTTCVDIVGPAYSFAIGLNSFTATAVDGAGNSTTETTSFTVVVTIASLKNLVRDFSTNDAVTRELIQKLNKNQLAAFRMQVQAQSGLAFTAEQAALLLRLATGL